jgi:hypothetical protein
VEEGETRGKRTHDTSHIAPVCERGRRRKKKRRGGESSGVHELERCSCPLAFLLLLRISCILENERTLCVENDAL